MHSQLSRCFILTVLVLSGRGQLGAAICDLGTTSEKLLKERGYDLTGQTHVITGGDSGIGFGIALALAQANARIIFLGHDMSKTAAAMRNITKRTSNNKLSSIPIDLMSFASVKEAAYKVLASVARIDVLICNAGLDVPLSAVPMTADGFESTFQIQYISHFYLVELLLPQLRKTRGRVVHTSCGLIDSCTLCGYPGFPKHCSSLEALSKIVHEPNQGSVSGNIVLSMWAKTMHARFLAHREASNGVTAYSFNPGYVETAHQRELDALSGGRDLIVQGCLAGSSPFSVLTPQVQCCLQNPAYRDHIFQCTIEGSSCLCPNKTNCPLTPEQGAVSAVYLAAAPQAELASINGALTVACGSVPLVYGDPYVEMVGQIGHDAALKFVVNLHQLSLSWIPSVSNVSSTGIYFKPWGFAASFGMGVVVASAAVIVIGIRCRYDIKHAALKPLLRG